MVIQEHDSFFTGRDELGTALFDCLKLHAAREQVRKLARLIQENTLMPEARRLRELAEYARREIALTDQLDKTLPLLEPGDLEGILGKN